jgi:hypothetical protein
MIQVLLFWTFAKVSVTKASSIGIAYTAIVAAPLLSGLLPEQVWQTVGASQLALVLCVKFPQIYASFSNGSTG